MNNYEAGHYAATEEAMKAILVLTERLAAARIDSAEWKEQHENLLAMFRASENRAAKAEAALRACRPEERVPLPFMARMALVSARDYLMWLVEFQGVKKGAVQIVREGIDRALAEDTPSPQLEKKD